MAEIIPAILTNDVSDFRKKYAEILALSHMFGKLHVDFADGVFVDSQTVMPKDLLFLSAVASRGGGSPLTLMAHFMTYHPQTYFRAAVEAGFEWVVVHFEAFDDKQKLEEALSFGEAVGLKMGIALNPETKLHQAAKFLTKVPIVQLMGIHPGAQGRKFMPETVEKVKELRALSKSVIIAVDGGVKVGIAKQCVQAGADLIIAGSAIFKSDNQKAAIEVLISDIET